MSSADELQKLYYDTLKASAEISALAQDVYDNVPENPFGAKTAYISFGPTNTVEDDADCIVGLEISSQIDIWSRSVGFPECKRLTDLVRRALHRRRLSLSDNSLVDLWVTLVRVFRDPDGITSHGVVQVTATVEEPS